MTWERKGLQVRHVEAKREVCVCVWGGGGGCVAVILSWLQPVWEGKRLVL